VQDLAFGYGYTLLLTINGDCYISGSNYKNQFGITETEQNALTANPNDYYWHNSNLIIKKFVNISQLKRYQLGNETIVKIATGPSHSLILTNKNKCYSFGLNENGVLGIGTRNRSNQWNLIAENVMDIGCGNVMSCYLTLSGQIYIFGSVQYDKEYHRILTPTLFFDDMNVTNMFVGSGNIGFIASNSLYVFGNNYGYKMGFKDSDHIYPPRLLLDEFDQPIQDVVKICFGYNYILVLTDKYLYVCGSNDDGQLGLGKVKHVDRPRIHERFLNHKVTDIAVSGNSSYVIADKICYVTGTNSYGQLGLGNHNATTEFVPLPLFTPEFVKFTESVKVRAGHGSVGLIIV
jgi:alpha-tubulin suppressor-like RCC1 family protein